MNTRGVTERLESANRVVCMVEGHAARAAAALDARLKVRPGEEPPRPYERLLRALAGEIRAEAETLAALDRARVAELAGDVAQRETRDQLAGELRMKVVRLRATLRTGYGPIADQTLQISGETPSEPESILRLVRTLRDNVARLALLDPVDPYFSYDAMAYVAALMPPADRLARVIESLERDSHRPPQMQASRNKAIARFDSVFTEAAGALYALFQVAGEPALAAEVRPASTRPGITAQAAGELEETPTYSGL